MNIYIVGAGKLANAILSSNGEFSECVILRWSDKSNQLNDRAILIHAGSGRQLDECISFCETTKSILIELSTGLKTETLNPDFPLVICPNTSILMLKTMKMLKVFGKSYQEYEVSITESHQASKITEPGTAFNFADSLALSHNKIVSIRDSKKQLEALGIPEEFAAKHAYHKILIKSKTEELLIETRVYGHDSYAKGVKEILEICSKLTLENRKYSILELIN